MENNNIIFLCGALRSGTSVLRLMLDSHPELMNPGEFNFLFDHMHDLEFPDNKTFIENLSIDRYFNTLDLKIDKSLGYEELLCSFIEQIKDKNKLLIMTINRNFDRAYKIFPKAKFIHVVRDPRDVARSCIGMNWVGNVYYGVDFWIDTEKSWDKLRPHYGNMNHIELRYENIILNTSESLNTICNFIGIPYSEKMLDYQNESTYSKPDASLTYQWKKKLSKRELQNVECKAIGLLVARGYEPSGYPVSVPGYMEKAWLFIQNKSYKLQKGFERYGFIQYTLYRLSGKMKLTSLHNKIKLNINRIDLKYLK